METTMKDLVARLEKVTARLEQLEGQLAKGGAPTVAAGAAVKVAAGVCVAKQEFDALIAKHLDPLLPLTEKISPTLNQLMKEFIAACKEESRIVGVAASSKKPDQPTMQKLVKQLSESLNKISEYKGKFGRAPEFNCIAGVSEAVPCLNWIMVEPAPYPFMKEMIPGSEFYTNRVLTAYKGKDQTYIDWVKGLNTFLKELAEYVKSRHTTGLTWNPNGGDALAVSEGAAAPAPSSGGAPPPPPPPPPVVVDAAPPKASGMSNVFQELNKGTNITASLSHVRDDQKTKNRPKEEREKKFEPTTTKATPAATTTAPVQRKKGPALFELKGTKWAVENQEDKTLTIDTAQMNHTIYVFGCTGTTVIVTNPKVNCVSIDNCNKCAVVVESVVSSVELVNTNNSQCQVKVKTPAINVDKCSGIELWLSAAACQSPLTEIYTAKCSAVNVLIPGATADADRIEMPIPEQFLSTVAGTKITTVCSSHV